MFRKFVVAAALACLLAGSGSAQTPPTPDSTAAPAPPKSNPPKPVAKKASAKPKVVVKPQRQSAETGPCKLGVMSAVGNRISVQKFGLTVFETEENEIPVDWGLDDLILNRVRAATGADPGVRRIGYAKGAFEPYYHPASRLLPDPREGLPAIVRSITPNANCERYLVMTRFRGQIPGTNLLLDGIGVYSRGIGSLARHARLFANIQINVLDGSTYERIQRPFANFGARLSKSFQLGEDDIVKLDNSLFPEPAAAAASSAMLRDRIRALVTAQMDETLPAQLKQE